MRSILAAFILSLTAAAAHATTFNFAYTGDGLAGSGTLTGALIAPGEYAVVSGTDIATGGGVSGALALLVNPASPSEILSPSGYFIYDDLLFPDSNPLVSNGGLLFTSATGGEVNIYSNGPSDYVYYDNTGFNEAISFDPSPVPEPATFALLATGIAGLMGVRKSKRAPK